MTDLYVLRTKQFVGCPAVHHSFQCTLNLLEKRLQKYRSMKMAGTSAEHLVQFLLRAGSVLSISEFTSSINFKVWVFFLLIFQFVPLPLPLTLNTNE